MAGHRGRGYHSNFLSVQKKAYKNQIANNIHWLDIGAGVPIFVSKSAKDLSYKNQIANNSQWLDMGGTPLFF